MTPSLDASPPAYVPHDPSQTVLYHVVADHLETCRQTFEERFSVTRMTQDYLRIYQQLLEPRTEHTAA